MIRLKVIALKKTDAIVRKAQNTIKKIPIVLVHGAWHKPSCWNDNFLSYFPDNGHDTYAVRLSEHGKSYTSLKNLRWTSLNDYVNDLSRVVDSLEEPPVLIGHSLGGAVVQKYLETANVPGAVLLASAPPHGILNLVFKLIRTHPIKYLESVLTTDLYHLMEDKQIAKELLYPDNISEEMLDKYHQKLQGESFRVLLDLLLFNKTQAKKVKSKILVLGAEKDWIFPPGELIKTSQAYNTEATIFPNMAHNMMLEDNWQDVAHFILDWVKTLQ